MKWSLLIFTLLIASHAFSQLPDNLLELQEKKVSKMYVSGSEEFWSFAYYGNEIVTNYVESHSFILVYRSYFNETKRPDSITVLEITKLDSVYQYTSVDYFQYEFDDLGRLKSETLFSDDLINKERFFYNEHGQLDSTAWFRNLKRELMGDKTVDSLILWETKKFSYDQSGLKTMVKYWNGRYETYEYNVDNQLLIKKYSPFSYQNGCQVDKDRYYKTETYFYNDRGLISKEVTKNYKLRKNGKWKRVYRGAKKYIYEYYRT